MAGGRPTAYKPEYAEQAHKLCLLGATDRELGEFFKVSQRTVDAWKLQHTEFLQSLKAGKQEADERVVRSLYQRASGYSHEAEKLFCHEGEVTRAQYVEHYPPDTTACIFWLKNRRPDQWRDAKDITVRKVDSLSEEQSRQMAEAMIESARASAALCPPLADSVHDSVSAGLQSG